MQLQVATERNLPISLKTAAVSQEITVTAEAPLVATTPAIGTVVSQQELEGLPLNGRQFANLAATIVEKPLLTDDLSHAIRTALAEPGLRGA